jgi:hypothetical protein
MKTIEEQKIEAIRKAIKPLFENDYDIDDEYYSKAILESLKQFEPEQLDVEMHIWDHKNVDVFLRGTSCFDSVEKALEFCKKYNLKVVGNERLF